MGARRYLLLFFAAALATWALALTVKFVNHGRDRIYDTLAQRLAGDPPAVLMFGDSALRQHGVCDRERLGTDEYLARAAQLAVYPVEHGAYSALMYREYARSIARAAVPPRLVLIPVNLRAWSPEWGDRPLYRFPLRTAYIRLRDGVGFAPLPVIAQLASDRDRAETRRWQDAEVASFAGERLGRNGELAREQLAADLDCGAPPASGAAAAVLRRKFLWHYGSTARAAEAMSAALAETVGVLRAAGIDVLVYVTPVNVEEAAAYAGAALAAAIGERATAIGARVLAAGGRFVDLHDLLPAGRFIDKHLACEHLDETGRRRLAERLAAELRRPAATPVAGG